MGIEETGWRHAELGYQASQTEGILSNSGGAQACPGTSMLLVWWEAAYVEQDTLHGRGRSKLSLDPY